MTVEERHTAGFQHTLIYLFRVNRIKMAVAENQTDAHHSEVSDAVEMFVFLTVGFWFFGHK